jgi:hypothetical protein
MSITTNKPRPRRASKEDRPTPTLASLAKRANQEHALVRASGQAMLQHALKSGQALILCKAEVKAKGLKWLPWLEENFQGSEGSAELYMRLARNSEHVQNLDPSEQSLRGALNSLRALRPKEKKQGKKTPAPVDGETILRQLEELDIDTLDDPSAFADQALRLLIDKVGPEWFAEQVAEFADRITEDDLPKDDGEDLQEDLKPSAKPAVALAKS